jgi:hypothetical protein
MPTNTKSSQSCPRPPSLVASETKEDDELKRPEYEAWIQGSSSETRTATPAMIWMRATAFTPLVERIDDAG